ncbi:MAG TPA: flagellar filament outer layer protein FlaA [Spirochaetota bacterium]|nr:flagellar filament outer layer protein FlaA [Spirochaetota bacterium]
MKKTIFILALLMYLSLPVTSQDNSGSNAEEESIYHIVALENFESSIYNNNNLEYMSAHYSKCRLGIADEFPSPENSSKKYLMLTLFGNQRDIATITPSAPIKISRYCKSISLWAYGKNSPGIISIFLKDVSGQQHRLIMGQLDFSGWKKLTAIVPSHVAQMDEYMNQQSFISLNKITIHPGSKELAPRYIFIFIDDISAVVRSKYLQYDSKKW